MSAKTISLYSDPIKELLATLDWSADIVPMAATQGHLVVSPRSARELFLSTEDACDRGNTRQWRRGGSLLSANGRNWLGLGDSPGTLTALVHERIATALQQLRGGSDDLYQWGGMLAFDLFEELMLEAETSGLSDYFLSLYGRRQAPPLFQEDSLTFQADARSEEEVATNLIRAFRCELELPDEDDEPWKALIGMAAGASFPLGFLFAMSLYLLTENRQRREAFVEDEAYSRGFMMECLRAFPSSWMLPRTALRDLSMNGYRIRAGDPVYLSPLVSHYHPDYWQQADEFDARRFTGKRDRGWAEAFLPFGLGARKCPASSQAMQLLNAFREGLRAQGELLAEIEVEDRPLLQPWISLRPALPMRLRPARG